MKEQQESAPDSTNSEAQIAIWELLSGLRTSIVDGADAVRGRATLTDAPSSPRERKYQQRKATFSTTCTHPSRHRPEAINNDEAGQMSTGSLVQQRADACERPLLAVGGGELTGPRAG